jgi:hypothetical protein
MYSDIHLNCLQTYSIFEFWFQNKDTYPLELIYKKKISYFIRLNFDFYKKKKKSYFIRLNFDFYKKKRLFHTIEF